MRTIHLSNERKRDAQVGFESKRRKDSVRYLAPDGGEYANVRFLKSTIDTEPRDLTAQFTDLAAALEGKRVDVEKIVSAVDRVSRLYDVTLVEGAGGLAVPLTQHLLTIDLAANMHWPAVLVVSGKLGSLNHALLSLEALARRKMTLRGIVYDYAPDVDPVIDRDTPQMLAKFLIEYGFPPVLVRLGKVDPAAPENTFCDFSPLFPEVLK